MTTHRFRVGTDSETPYFLAFRLIALLVVFLVIGPSPSSAQHHGKPEKPYALIFGTVWGPDDHPTRRPRARGTRPTRSR